MSDLISAAENVRAREIAATAVNPKSRILSDQDRELLTALLRNGEGSLDTFIAWVDDRWERDPRSIVGKLDLLGLGLVGEAAEISEPIKKFSYSGAQVSREYLLKELGDLLHYWARACRVAGVDPRWVMAANVDKLVNRSPEGYAPVPDNWQPFITGDAPVNRFLPRSLADKTR